MSHANRSRKNAMVGQLEKVTAKEPRVIKATSVPLQQLLAQTRGILGLIGLGALPLNNQELPEMELAIKRAIQEFGCSYLVPATVAEQVLAIARQDYPESRLRTDLFTTIQVFGRAQKFVPIYVEQTSRETTK